MSLLFEIMSDNVVFITNAGHELKTPLAIISANNELVEMMNGESEWTKSTNDQVERMTGLINSLVAMARLEEQPEVVLTDLNFSAIAEDAAEDLKVLSSKTASNLSWKFNLIFMSKQKKNHFLN